jgi:hypothetical protein
MIDPVTPSTFRSGQHNETIKQCPWPHYYPSSFGGPQPGIMLLPRLHLWRCLCKCDCDFVCGCGYICDCVELTLVADERFLEPPMKTDGAASLYNYKEEGSDWDYYGQPREFYEKVCAQRAVVAQRRCAHR